MFSIGVSCWYYEVMIQKCKFNMAKRYSNTGYSKRKKYMYSWMV